MERKKRPRSWSREGEESQNEPSFSIRTWRSGISGNQGFRGDIWMLTTRRTAKTPEHGEANVKGKGGQF
jgi:hypothetical protein